MYPVWHMHAVDDGSRGFTWRISDFRGSGQDLESTNRLTVMIEVSYSGTRALGRSTIMDLKRALLAAGCPDSALDVVEVGLYSHFYFSRLETSDEVLARLDHYAKANESKRKRDLEQLELLKAQYPEAALVEPTTANEEAGTPPTCVLCGRSRTVDDFYDYNPLQVVTDQSLGWYSGDDGEMCPECMTRTIRNQ